MNITIQTVRFKGSDELNDLIEEKVGKLFNHHPETIRVDVTLKEGAKNNPTNKWCQIYLSHPGENLFVKKNSKTYEESVHLAVDAMAKKIRRLKK